MDQTPWVVTHDGLNIETTEGFRIATLFTDGIDPDALEIAKEHFKFMAHASNCHDDLLGAMVDLLEVAKYRHQRQPSESLYEAIGNATEAIEKEKSGRAQQASI